MSPEELRARNKARLEAKREQLMANKELGKPIKELTKEVEQLAKSMQNTGIDDAAQAINATVNTLQELSKTIKKTDDKNVAMVAEKVAQLADRIAQIEINPQIEVKPVVDIDLSPITKALPKSVTKVSIEDFRAQDLDEEEPGVQFVGFVAPNGNWMIIRNDVEKNSMRYKFGKKDYAKAWPKLATFNYQTLDKAYDEIKT